MTPGERSGAARREWTLPVTWQQELRHFAKDALDGLTSPQKSLSSKYFYDEAGSRLFDEITELEEYYPTRTETSIMEASVEEMARAVGPEALVVEFGSGSSVKTRILLEALERPVAYVPIDISGEYLEAVAEKLRADHPGIDILPVAADFTKPVRIPAPPRPAARTVVYFPGSTIGNFTRFQAQRLLARMAAIAGPSGCVLLGADQVKPEPLLRAAYNDSRGVTARFNLNLLVRLNRELGADFNLAAFRHEAVYDPEEARVEMRLVSLMDQRVHLAGHVVDFRRGEHILTEYSHKYTDQSLGELARGAGLVSRRAWTDPQDLFSIHLLEVAPT